MEGEQPSLMSFSCSMAASGTFPSPLGAGQTQSNSGILLKQLPWSDACNFGLGWKPLKLAWGCLTVTGKVGGGGEGGRKTPGTTCHHHAPTCLPLHASPPGLAHTSRPSSPFPHMQHATCLPCPLPVDFFPGIGMCLFAHCTAAAGRISRQCQTLPSRLSFTTPTTTGTTALFAHLHLAGYSLMGSSSWAWQFWTRISLHSFSVSVDCLTLQKYLFLYGMRSMPRRDLLTIWEI